MFRYPKLLEKTNMARFDLTTPLTFPANGHTQEKTGWRFEAMTETGGLIGIMPISE